MKTIASLMGYACMISATIVPELAAADLEHIDQVAFSIKRQTARLCRELNLGFRRAPQYPDLYKDVYAMYQLADHMHEIAHHTNNVRHLRADASELDELMHHVQELFSQASVGHVRRRITSAQGIHLRLHGGGLGLQGYHTRRFQSMLEGLEDSVHHLLEDLDVNSRQPNLSPIAPPLPPAAAPQPSIRVPTVYRSVPSRGLSIPISRKGRFLFSLTIR